jgi:hypothetical protein
MCIHKPK